MSDTKERILMTALRLFARDGYEAVSVSEIAGKLGMTKGALYKHYKNKRDIFDSIVARMFQLDSERAQEYEVPEDTFENMPESYQCTNLDHIREFTIAQYSFWADDEFAANFRKMLTLEQYRNKEMNELYQNCIVSGPVQYMEDMFREMIAGGVMKEADPKQLAVEFFAPLFLLINMADANDNQVDAKDILSAHIERFLRNNSK
ncbi:MAG: TetR/AcrR family transcriptional regulator [Lachnospiraceae bacterium]|nr:TetR/AcrR family transcriptional regulator [Lachnospiraceae bacterium]